MDEASSAHAVHTAKEKERFDNLPENQNSGKSGMQAIPIQHVDMLSPQLKRTPGFQSTLEKELEYQNTKSVVTNEAGPAHNLHVAREKERQHQLRLHRLHQFIRNEMAERHEKAKKDRSIQTFKELQKTAIFLNYDLRYVSKIYLLKTYISKLISRMKNIKLHKILLSASLWPQLVKRRAKFCFF